MSPRPGEAGLTLVEMLVVLAIIGVAAGATVLGIGAATRAPSAESEARRLAATVQAAADLAMVVDRPLALVWTERGYHVAGAEGEAAQVHRLPGGMRLSAGSVRARGVPAAGGAGGTVPVSIDGTGLPFAARLATATDAWMIGYDGLKAAATRVPPG